MFNRISLCSSLYLMGEPEEALRLGHLLLEESGTVRSYRVVSRLRNLRRDLAPHRHLSEVRTFEHQLLGLPTGRQLANG